MFSAKGLSNFLREELGKALCFCGEPARDGGSTPPRPSFNQPYGPEKALFAQATCPPFFYSLPALSLSLFAFSMGSGPGLHPQSNSQQNDLDQPKAVHAGPCASRTWNALGFRNGCLLQTGANCKKARTAFQPGFPSSTHLFHPPVRPEFLKSATPLLRHTQTENFP
jgi:hypothetical protein